MTNAPQRMLSPVVHHDAYTASIKRDVIGYFQEVLITPLEARFSQAFEGAGRYNATISPVQVALQDGRIWYEDGAFRGTFNAETSAALKKIGAKFKGRSKVWEIPLSDIPLDIRHSIYANRERAKKTIAAIAALVLLMRSHLDAGDTGIDTVATQKRILDSANGEFNRSLQDFREGFREVGIPAKMKSVADEINEAIKADAKRVMREELEKLSDELATLENSEASLEALKKTIENVKRRILVRTETLSEHAAALLLSQYRREQAERLGLSAYIWKDMGDNKVRHDHKLLNGNRFTWDNPPITNRATGDRNAPGEDYNCRCVPVLLINESFDA